MRNEFTANQAMAHHAVSSRATIGRNALTRGVNRRPSYLMRTYYRIRAAFGL